MRLSYSQEALVGRGNHVKQTLEFLQLAAIRESSTRTLSYEKATRFSITGSIRHKSAARPVPHLTLVPPRFTF